MKLQQISNLNIKIYFDSRKSREIATTTYFTQNRKQHEYPTILKEFFPALCFFALLVLLSSALTYRVIISESSWEGLGTFKIVYLIILWTFVGSGILTTCFTALWTLFSRTMVTIKPDGDQEEPLQVIVVGPFDRRVTHL